VEYVGPSNVDLYLWRPCLSDPALCRDFYLLEDGTYSIDDLADMHEVLDVLTENRRRRAAYDREQQERTR